MPPKTEQTTSGFNTSTFDGKVEVDKSKLKTTNSNSKNGNAYGGYGTAAKKKDATDVADANFNNSLEQLKIQQDAAKQNYNNSIKGNRERAQAAIRDIATGDEWFNTQLKLQNTYKNQRDANGNGAYGSGMDALNSTVKTYDAVQDRNMLDSELQQKNSIYSDWQQADLDSVNTYNNTLAATKQGYLDAKVALANDYYNNAGEMTFFKTAPTKAEKKLIKKYLQSKKKKSTPKALQKQFDSYVSKHTLKNGKINKIANKTFNPEKLEDKAYVTLKQDQYTRQPGNTYSIRAQELDGINNISNSSGANANYLQKRYG